jgi:3-hydroxybutyryl-CoA dehydrogenase
MAGADLIVEAATEREDIKQKIFAAAGAVLAPHAILASNTSSIPITRMAARTVDPARFIGLHFFNPVPVMKLVEVIPGLATAPATIEAMHALVGRLNKVMVLSQDEAGFIVNRILVPMLNEAVFVLWRHGQHCRHRQGLRLASTIRWGRCNWLISSGWIPALKSARVCQQHGRWQVSSGAAAGQICRGRWLGRKTGRGFYDYSGETPVPTR